MVPGIVICGLTLPKLKMVSYLKYGSFCIHSQGWHDIADPLPPDQIMATADRVKNPQNRNEVQNLEHFCLALGF